LFNPKFRLGEKVVVGDGILTGTISDIIYNSSGFQYMLAEYPDIFNEDELTSLEEKEDIVTIDLDDNDDEIKRLDFVKAKGTDAVFVVRKIEGDNAYIINISNGKEIMFPVSKLEHETDEEKVEKAINPELVDTIDKKLGFEIGDLVKVKGYTSIFTITGCNKDKTEFKVKPYFMEEIAGEMVAFPEDMELADEEDIEEYEQHLNTEHEFKPVDLTFFIQEFKPVDMKLVDFKKHGDKFQFRSKEKEILNKLEHNRQVIAKLKEWQDWFFEAYSFTKDEKYIRRIKRVQGWINKIPTRAYQIK